jgi:hypothetical protein
LTSNECSPYRHLPNGRNGWVEGKLLGTEVRERASIPAVPG